MPSYSAAVHIAAPPEAIFGLVADLARHGEWSADPLEIAARDDAHYTSSTRSKGKAIAAELTVVESKAPERFVFEATDITGSWRHTFTLTPNGTGTTVRRTIAGRLSPAQSALFWVVLLPVKKPNAKRALVRLKDLVERA